MLLIITDSIETLEAKLADAYAEKKIESNLPEDVLDSKTELLAIAEDLVNRFQPFTIISHLGALDEVSGDSAVLLKGEREIPDLNRIVLRLKSMGLVLAEMTVVDIYHELRPTASQMGLIKDFVPKSPQRSIKDKTGD